MNNFNAPHVDYAGLSPVIALTAGLCIVLIAGLFLRSRLGERRAHDRRPGRDGRPLDLAMGVRHRPRIRRACGSTPSAWPQP